MSFLSGIEVEVGFGGDIELDTVLDEVEVIVEFLRDMGVMRVSEGELCIDGILEVIEFNGEEFLFGFALSGELEDKHGG